MTQSAAAHPIPEFNLKLTTKPMNISHLTKHKILASTLLGAAASLLVTIAADAAFVPVPDNTTEVSALAVPNVTPDNLTGTVVFSLENSYVDSFGSTATGRVRSMAVQNSIGTLDFYYQIINTSTNSFDLIFRPEFAGYGNDTQFNLFAPGGAGYRTDGTLPGLLNVPLTFTTTNLPTPGKVVETVDRDPINVNIPDSVAFDLDTDFFGGSNRIGAGQASNWLVLRTSANAFGTNLATINSTGGTGFATAVVPIPEPSTILFGVAMLGVCAGGRFRKSFSGLES